MASRQEQLINRDWVAIERGQQQDIAKADSKMASHLAVNSDQQAVIAEQKAEENARQRLADGYRLLRKGEEGYVPAADDTLA